MGFLGNVLASVEPWEPRFRVQGLGLRVQWRWEAIDAVIISYGDGNCKALGSSRAAWLEDFRA